MPPRKSNIPLPQTPPPSKTFNQQRQAARTQARTAARAKLAKTGAGFTPEGAAVAGASFAAGEAKRASQAQLPTGDRQYQGVILAEFVLAALIVSVGPIAQPPSDGKAGASPYRVNDIKQLLAIGLVYFILALLSSGNRGRLAAWFGGLILLGLLLAEFANGKLGATFGAFTPSGAAETPQQEQNAANNAANAAAGALGPPSTTLGPPGTIVT